MHVSVIEEVMGIEQIERFRGDMPTGWNGIRSVTYANGKISNEVFRDGEVLAEIEQLDGSSYRIPGRTQPYPHIAFAAIDVINDQG
jgi:hypothetical protein